MRATLSGIESALSNDLAHALCHMYLTGSLRLSLLIQLMSTMLDTPDFVFTQTILQDVLPNL